MSNLKGIGQPYISVDAHLKNSRHQHVKFSRKDRVDISKASYADSLSSRSRKKRPKTSKVQTSNIDLMDHNPSTFKTVTDSNQNKSKTQSAFNILDLAMSNDQKTDQNKNSEPEMFLGIAQDNSGDN